MAEYALDTWQAFVDFASGRMPRLSQYVWRGQRSSGWGLRPSIVKGLEDSGSISPAEDTSRLLEWFKYASRGRHPLPPGDGEDVKWWSIGRHYGLDTPLLDWSRSPFIAAFFAFENPRQSDTGFRAVWALAKDTIEQEVKKVKAEIEDAHQGIEFVDPLTHDNARLVNQCGLFTISPLETTIEDWVKSRFEGEDLQVLIKVTLPETERTTALAALNRMNINHLTLFPDLSGAAQYCNLKLRIPGY